MTDDTKGPLLNLDTLIVRPHVIVDGQAYEMVSPDELSILDRQRQGARGRRIRELMLKLDLSSAEQAELPRLLDEACRTILVGAPDEIHAKLKDGHRLDVVDAFGQLLLKGRRTAAEEPKKDPATGASSSPASPASTGGLH